MNDKSISLATKLPLLSVCLYLVVTLLLFVSTSSEASELAQKDKQALIYLLKQDCGSCHGLTLQGGLGPALLKKNLKNKPVEYLYAVIAEGRPGTPMPPWKEILSQAEMQFLASYLVSDRNVLANYLPKKSNAAPKSNSTSKKGM